MKAKKTAAKAKAEKRSKILNFRHKKKHQKQQSKLSSNSSIAAPPYDRAKDLVSLLALWPSEVSDTTIKGTQNIISKIQRALRRERKRANAKHWTYSLTRHLGLIKALKQEQALLEKQQNMLKL